MTSLPPGKYTMVNASVRLSYGGATRSQLLRARLFAQSAAQPVDIVTFDVYPEYDQERLALRHEGLICEGVNLLNLHEELAKADAGALGEYANEHAIPDWYCALDEMQYVTEDTIDGRPYRRKYDATGENRSFFFSYLRPDGSVYATVDRRLGGSDWDRQKRGTVLTSHDGQSIGFYESKIDLISRWLELLGSEADDHFVIFDSKESGFLIAEQQRAANQHYVLLAHTPHLQPPRAWDSKPASKEWGDVLEGLALWDGVVVLSEAHRRDLELRYGKRNNFFVIPHPAEKIRPNADKDEREEDLVLIVCRLENQKRLQDAIQAFAYVLKDRPTARMEIYGTGSKLQEWSNLVQELSVAHAVKFMGYDPRPERQYARGTVFVMTSLFEAQPLTLLEAAAHGCPIVSYDIKYGPAEMIQQGYNGYLSPEGDIKQLAEKILSVLSSERLEEMSDASVKMAESFAVPVFIDRWSNLFSKVLSQKTKRAYIHSSEFTINRISSTEAKLASIDMTGKDIGISVTSSRVEMAGTLSLSFNGDSAHPADTSICIRTQAADGDVVYLPTEVQRLGMDRYLVTWALEESETSPIALAGGLQYEVTCNNDQVLRDITIFPGIEVLFPETTSLVE